MIIISIKSSEKPKYKNNHENTKDIKHEVFLLELCTDLQRFIFMPVQQSPMFFLVANNTQKGKPVPVPWGGFLAFSLCF